MTKTVKVKARKGCIVRRDTFRYTFKTDEIKEVPEKDWESMKEVDYLEEVKTKKKEVDE